MFDGFWQAQERHVVRRAPVAAQRAVGTAAAVAFLGFLFYASLVPAGFANGDGAVYAQQILQRDFAGRSVHLGYYLLGAVFTGFSEAAPDLAFNLLSAGSSALTLAFIALLGIAWTGRLAGGWVSAAVLAVSWPFATASTQAEVYGLQTCLLVAAVWLYWSFGGASWGPPAAGLAFAASVLVTPSTLFAAPAFLVIRRPRLRALATFGLSAAAWIAGALAVVWRDYFFGDRGLLAASTSGVDIPMAVLKEGFEVAFGFFAALPWLVLGLWRLGTRPEHRPLGLGLAFMGTTTFFLGERFRDVPVQLPTYALLAPVAALGWCWFADAVAQRTGKRGSWWALCGLSLVPPALAWLVRGRVDDLGALPVWWIPALGTALAAALVVCAVLDRGDPRGGRSTLPAALILAVTLGVNGLWATRLVSEESRRVDAYRERILTLGEVGEPGFLTVGTWDRGILFEHYLHRVSYTGHWINTAWLAGTWGEDRRVEAEAQLDGAIAAGRELWLLSEHGGTRARLEAAGYVLAPVADLQGFLRARPRSGGGGSPEPEAPQSGAPEPGSPTPRQPDGGEDP
ncbi:MAG: hypothetical protein AAGD06_01025 [Acidobacteriota bacterium]